MKPRAYNQVHYDVTQTQFDSIFHTLLTIASLMEVTEDEEEQEKLDSLYNSLEELFQRTHSRSF